MIKIKKYIIDLLKDDSVYKVCLHFADGSEKSFDSFAKSFADNETLIELIDSEKSFLVNLNSVSYVYTVVAKGNQRVFF